MHVFYYGNATVDKNSLGWKSNAFQWKGDRNRREGQKVQLDVIDKTHKEIQTGFPLLHRLIHVITSFFNNAWVQTSQAPGVHVGNRENSLVS